MGWATAIGYAVKAGGSIISAVGSYRASKERENVARFNAQVAKEQGLAKKAAIDSQNRINTEVNRDEMSTTEATGGLRGIVMSEGSPLLAETEQYADAIADATEMTRQGEVAKIQGENQAAMFNYQARSAKKGRWWGVAGSLLQGMG